MRSRPSCSRYEFNCGLHSSYMYASLTTDKGIPGLETSSCPSIKCPRWCCGAVEICSSVGCLAPAWSIIKPSDLVALSTDFLSTSRRSERGSTSGNGSSGGNAFVVDDYNNVEPEPEPQISIPDHIPRVEVGPLPTAVLPRPHISVSNYTPSVECVEPFCPAWGPPALRVHGTKFTGAVLLSVIRSVDRLPVWAGFVDAVEGVKSWQQDTGVVVCPPHAPGSFLAHVSAVDKKTRTQSNSISIWIGCEWP